MAIGKGHVRLAVVAPGQVLVRGLPDAILNCWPIVVIWAVASGGLLCVLLDLPSDSEEISGPLAAEAARPLIPQSRQVLGLAERKRVIAAECLD